MNEDFSLAIFYACGDVPSRTPFVQHDPVSEFRGMSKLEMRRGVSLRDVVQGLVKQNESSQRADMRWRLVAYAYLVTQKRRRRVGRTAEIITDFGRNDHLSRDAKLIALFGVA